VDPLLLTAVILAFVLFNGLYVAAEFAVIAMPRTLLEQRAEGGEAWARRLLRVVEDASLQDRYIAVAQLGITLASLALGMFGEHALAVSLTPAMAVFGGAAEDVATGVSLLVLTFVHIVAGEMIPKSLALLHPVATARAMTVPMAVTGVAIAPLVWLLNHAGNMVLRALRLPVSRDISFVYSTEELIMLFDDSRREGLLEGEQFNWMKRLLSLDARTLAEIMVPRARMQTLSADATMTAALELARREEFTRYPLRDGDAFIGYLHVKDLFLEPTWERPLRAWKRDAPFLPDSLPLDVALERLRSQRAHLALVVDEHGGTAGMITLEDLVEEIFGAVRDEVDEAEAGEVQCLPGGTPAWRVQGEIALAELSDQIGRRIPAGGAKTLNGLLMARLQRPPREGDAIDTAGVRIEAEEVRNFVAVWCRVTISADDGPRPDTTLPSTLDQEAR